ncbi:NAD(P) transhydrogenase subunit alpha [Putridiphycobacter roseus]|uniref:proton-translocating NAD(P)(+) transhydrogenase n=1 Tax=Putridiphycobacter roseus TaxID=2219161 RepID=A0A2W1NPK6_9FLAO|nr:NAD(P) transhydrogenase subunit alpha [Putridiphycobacter roseus]PZE17562.1 NAD(P) transhydrogenase subunit alpha [Putridiphycobacter roseus]
MQNLLEFIQQNQQLIYLVILMMFLGVEVISNVPSILHTPLMSGANAIHGVIVIGAIIVMGESASDDYLSIAIGSLAVIVGTLNMVGGFVVTDRMLAMFKVEKKNKVKK